MSATFTHEGTFRADLDAGDLKAGTVATARLGSGSATSGTFLRGDQTWASPPAGSKFADTLAADGIQTTYTVTHNLGTKDVIIQFHHRAETGLNTGLYDIHYGPNVMFAPTVEHLNANEVFLSFGTAPEDKEWRIIIYKI